MIVASSQTRGLHHVSRRRLQPLRSLSLVDHGRGLPARCNLETSESVVSRGDRNHADSVWSFRLDRTVHGSLVETMVAVCLESRLRDFSGSTWIRRVSKTELDLHSNTFHERSVRFYRGIRIFVRVRQIGLFRNPVTHWKSKTCVLVLPERRPDSRSPRGIAASTIMTAPETRDWFVQQELQRARRLAEPGDGGVLLARFHMCETLIEGLFVFSRCDPQKNLPRFVRAKA